MNDLKFAFCQLLKDPGFTTVVVLALALGIGAATAIFSFVDAVLIRPLPFKDADRLVMIWERNPAQGYDQNGARAIITRPRLLLADEPTGNLHSEQGRQIMELFQKLNREGTTIIQVTHSEFNAGFGNRVLHIFDGRIEEPENNAGARTTEEEQAKRPCKLPFKTFVTLAARC